ncbi:NDP-sugar synthase [Methanomicrobium sp. W14]|uniref:nucleotidyltransferase family protein n=1 Tax=Methanomicrobium sp. W14 TaxID=2817839 RepID=UPI001FDA6AFF|nr:NDP-sugar synthase [Methanomicrobium sp. W14]
MCGGEGTRLRPLTFERPKPCIPIVNTPSIQHLVSHLSNLGFSDIIVTIGYKGDEIQKALGDGSLFGVNITYVREDKKLGTAGSVKNAEKYLKGSPFLVVGGDHVTDVDLLSFYREHIKGESIVSIGLISIDEPCDYGIAEIDVNYHLKRFREKPSPGEIFSNLASTGIYVCDPEIFNYIPEAKKFDFAKDLFPLMMQKGIIIKGWLARGNWTDVGSPQSLRQAEHWKLQDMHYTNIKGNVTIKGAHVLGPVQLGDSVIIGENSRIIGPVSIGSGTCIGENVLIGPYTSIGEHCRIAHDSKIFSSSIYNHVDIGSQTTISGSIIDDDAKTGVLCSIENDTVIGPRTELKNRVIVHSGTRIWPEVVIEEGQVVKEYLLNEKFDTSYSGS